MKAGLSTIELLVAVVMAAHFAPTTAQDQCATDCDDVVTQYLGNIGGGNITGACQHVAPGFVFTWHGAANLVPIAGTYIGCLGLETFFSKVGQVVRNFSFYNSFAPESFGIKTLGASCGTVVKQWEEISVVVATGKPVTRAVNTVVYTLNTTASPPILMTGDVFVDVSQYATAFCPGQVACFNSGAVATGGTSCPIPSSTSSSGTSTGVDASSTSDLATESQLGTAIGLIAVSFVCSLVGAVLGVLILRKQVSNTSSI